MLCVVRAYQSGMQAINALKNHKQAITLETSVLRQEKCPRGQSETQRGIKMRRNTVPKNTRTNRLVGMTALIGSLLEPGSQAEEQRVFAP